MTRANYQIVGIHKASLPCLSCQGEGTVRGYPCALCQGRKTYEVGCGGSVERDLNHSTMCSCLTCGRFIDPAEVTEK